MARRTLAPDWASLPDDALFDVTLSNLPLAIEGALAARIAQLRDELASVGLGCPLHFYLSDEWFTPDGGTAIAVPFYLAHPRLERLEEAQMFEVEGGEHGWAMRILRHEAGHAIDNAFRLRLKRQRRVAVRRESFVAQPIHRLGVAHGQGVRKANEQIGLDG